MGALKVCSGRAVLLAALATAGIAPPALAQAPIVNAQIERRSVAGGLEADVRAVIDRGIATWIAYRVPMIAGEHHLVSPYDLPDGRCCVCRLDGATGVTRTDGAPRGLRVTLESPTELLVFARADAGRIIRLRTFTPDCEIDGGGMPLVWLDGVGPDESVAWLISLIRTSTRDLASRAEDRVAHSALAAVALHAAPSAVSSLIAIARGDADARRRGQALFWLAQRAGSRAAETITAAIDDDPEIEVKKRAVFALGQLPKDDGVPKLIELARAHRNPQIRRQAMIVLGLTNDPRAVTFFEEILSR